MWTAGSIVTQVLGASLPHADAGNNEETREKTGVFQSDFFKRRCQ